MFIGLIFTSIIVFYFIKKIGRIYLEDDKIENAIVNHYRQNDLIVNNISVLNLTEKIKYGGSFFPILSFFYFGIITGKIDYLRKVSISDKKDREYTKYIELNVQSQKIIFIKEFASYDF